MICFLLRFLVSFNKHSPSQQMFDETEKPTEPIKRWGESLLGDMEMLCQLVFMFQELFPS